MEPAGTERPAGGRLVALIAQRRVRLGQLVDFADSLPSASIEEAIFDLFRTAEQHRATGIGPLIRLRYFVILGALLTRLLFELEGLGTRTDWL